MGLWRIIRIVCCLIIDGLYFFEVLFAARTI